MSPIIRRVSPLKRVCALIVVVVLLSQATLAAPETPIYIWNTAVETERSIGHTVSANFASLSLLRMDTVKAWLAKLGKRQEALERIVIRPTNEDGGFTMMQGEKAVFSATGYVGDQAIGGIDFKWSESDGRYTGGLIAGTFEPVHRGIYTITATTVDGQRASITVKVYPNEGASVTRLLAKQQADLTDKEKAEIAKMRSDGRLTSRGVISTGRYDAAIEKRLFQADQAKRASVAEAQEQYRRNNPDPFAAQAPAEPGVSHGGPSADSTGDTGIPEPPSAPATRSVRGTKSKAALFNRPAVDDGWDGSNWYTADDPGNRVGSPAGSAPDAGAADGNFQINAPVLALAGRGLNVDLSLVYNSRLWGKSGTLMSYDNDQGFPAPGWNLGFGKMMYMGGTGGCMLVTPDGTRRSFANPSPYVYSYSTDYINSTTEHTTDGSFIDYTCMYQSHSYGKSLSGSASLPNGTTITYGSASSSYEQVYPTQITDAQGNYINITYVGGHGPAIDTISDTLGRTITFNYDSSGRLITITGPGYNGTTRTFVKLHYASTTLSYAFASGYTTDVPGGDTQNLIDAIYYPDTNMGYWFGDSDSYSSYGMIAKVIEQRGMSWSGTSGTQGTVSQGTMNDQKVYNYPMTATSILTDAPGYTTRTETWSGMDTSPTTTCAGSSSAAAVTCYALSSTSSDQITTVTMPDGTVNVQTSHIDPGYGDDGYYYQGEVYASASALASASTPLAKTKTYFGAGDYGSTRPTKIEKTDELSQMTSVEFTYASSSYNQLITQKEYGYGGTTLYRQTNNTYENSTNYTGRHLFNLLKTTELLDASGNRLTRTEYEYDNYTSNPLVATPSVVHHNDSSDPYTTNTHLVKGDCEEWNHEECTTEGSVLSNAFGIGQHSGGPSIDVADSGESVFGSILASPYCVCIIWNMVPVTNYNPNTVYRGNVTKVTNYSHVSDLTGANSYDFGYDITGNQRTATTNCCQQMSFDYTTNTQYSQPESHTKGSSSTSSSLRMTESSTYDFNTGAQLTSTDFNGITTTNSYDSAVRPTLVTLHTGATAATSYDDANLAVTSTSKLSDGTTIVSETSQTINGRGQPVLSKYFVGGSTWNATSVQYDAMGRKWKTSMPYDASGSPSSWTVVTYDGLSRPSQTTAPDSSTSKMFYNEPSSTVSRPDSASSDAGQTVRSQDAWGRERWARTDAFGRLVEVVEPNPASTTGSVNATGSLKTSYAYDELDQLTTITQGSQTRSFKYDSLGRLTRQKLAEQTATINDAGTYVGSGGTGASWSEAFTYDARSNVTQRTDARGVKTNYSYLISGSTDPLNRLQGISYDTATADTTNTIDTAPAVSISYMSTGDQARVSQVTTSGVSTEANNYDTEGRISAYTLTMNGRSSYPFQTDYSYDSANRLTQVTYPAQYGMTGSPRHAVAPSYDTASRLAQLNIDSSTYLGNLSYNTASQVTQLKVGAATANPRIENYSYDSYTGLLTGQSVTNVGATSTYMDLSYSYNRGGSAGSLSGKTGQMTQMLDNLDHNRDRKYEFDGLGRIAYAKGGTDAGASGVTAGWTQSYSYDRYGNKLGVTATGQDQNSATIPTDGLSSVTASASTNRITSPDWSYDLAGNLIRGQDQSGVWQRFEYDAAGRLVKIMDDSSNVIETYTYGASRERLINTSSTDRTYYVWGGSSVVAEYTEPTSSSIPAYAKSYFYAGARLLMTANKASSTTETQQFQHPDRLGTQFVTDGATGASFRQTTFPFGTTVSAETTGNTNQVFTSYDRDAGTGLDYAVNRTYSKGQGRFTQVDPSQMGAARLGNPQSNNIYAYTWNMPTDFVDPTGLNLAYYDVRTGMGCVLMGDGKYHCTEYISRYWYDDGIGGDSGRAGGNHDPLDPPAHGGGSGGAAGKTVLTPRSKILQDAINTARALLKNKDCNDAVSSAVQDGRSAAATLDLVDGAAVEQPESDGGGYLAWTSPITLTITFYKGFYGDDNADVDDDSGKPTHNTVGLIDDPNLRRALTVLHELSHATGRHIGHARVSDPQVNRRIYDACIKKANGGKSAS